MAGHFRIVARSPVVSHYPVMEDEYVEDELAARPHLFDESFVLPTDISPQQLQTYIDDLAAEIQSLETQVTRIQNTRKKAPGSSEEEYEVEIFDIPPHCVPIKCVSPSSLHRRISLPTRFDSPLFPFNVFKTVSYTFFSSNSARCRTDVRTFDWARLAQHVQFDVIVMDPPWQLASAAPTRGVALGYKQLPNADIANLPIPALQQNGFIFIWVINARYSYAIDLMEKWGYSLIDGALSIRFLFSAAAALLIP